MDMLLTKSFIPTISPNISDGKISPSKVATKTTSANKTLPPQRRQSTSAFEARVSLLFALASQSASLSQRGEVLSDLISEASRYVVPKRFETRNLEEVLMAVPDLETVNFKVLRRKDEYQIRQVEPYFVAETTMPGKNGFDFYGSSQSFNVLAEYLFGKNTSDKKMEMTTPVVTRKIVSDGEKMEMTTPVITRKVGNREKWEMSFVMPSKYGAKLPIPKDPSVRIREVPGKIVAVTAFSGFVTDEEVERKEYKLRDALKKDKEFQIKDGALVEVAQFNPPFSLPFTRRNEVALEVKRREE